MSKFIPTPAQEDLMAALAGVKWLRLEKGGQYSMDDAEILERERILRLDHKFFTGKELVACVAKLIVAPTPRKERTQNERHENNTRVSIIRTEHGWHDGMICGKIIGPYGDGYVVLGDDGIKYDIPRHRDVRKI